MLAARRHVEVRYALDDGDATRQNIVESIQDLIVKSQAGDVLVLRYSGHGTTIDDLDGDDLEEAKRTGETKDEALCPVDFRDGELLIDDDLGQLWDLLPEEVNLTDGVLRLVSLRRWPAHDPRTGLGRAYQESPACQDDA